MEYNITEWKSVTGKSEQKIGMEELRNRLRDYADEMEKKGVILEVPLIREQKDEV